ncbi:MAG: alpha-hydroxy acid oxidase [Pseudomonadota bacterium]
MDLDLKYPEMADLRARAKRRIPRFAFDYLDSGTGRELGLCTNREALDRVQFMPQILRGQQEANLSVRFMGTDYPLPFGIAPIGMSGMIWPGAEAILAKAAARLRLPYCLSTVATKLPEDIGPLAGDMGWFQLYPPRDKKIRDDVLHRAAEAGFTKLILTVDVPGESRRERQRRAQVTMPPVLTPWMIWQTLISPVWAWGMSFQGMPDVVLPASYLTEEQRTGDKFMHAGRLIRGYPSWDMLEDIRAVWKGDLLIKGVMVSQDARRLVDAGADGIWVSNHSARQFDGGPAPIDMLPGVRAAVGPAVPVIYDSGVTGGLDIMRALALGANFVMLGRAWHYAVAALDERGPAHMAQVLEQDMRLNMAQIGAEKLDDLADRVLR